MTWSVCVLPHRHDPQRQRSSLDGLLVCAGCFAGLEQAVAEMPAHFDALARALAPRAGTGPQVTGTRERALPIDPTVADHRTDLAAKLVSWALLVSEEREIGAPRSSEVSVVAPWLLVHLRWASAQPWIDDYATELRSIRSRSLSLLYPSGRRRVEVGACIEDGCDGVLTATIAPADDLLPSEITCSHDAEHAWEASRWVALGRRIFGAASVNRAGATRLVAGTLDSGLPT